jgi:CHAD domain-containing protein
MNVSTSCDRLWSKRLHELTSVWPDFVGGRTTGLHKVRVASRRIREALPVVAVAAPASKVKKLNRKMRDLTRYLGPIRELDVELDLLEHESKHPDIPSRAVETMRREIASKRDGLRHGLEKKAPIGDLKKLVRKLERIAERDHGKDKAGKRGDGGKREEGRGKKGEGPIDRAFEDQWRGALATRLMRRAKSLRVALEKAGPFYAPERIHDVRIATKKLRYALEIAHDAGVPDAAARVKLLKRQQERLGRLHDLQLLLKHLREAEAAPGSGARADDLIAYADVLERDCRTLHAGFVEHRQELAECVRAVRQQLVPALTMPRRRQARVNSSADTASRPRSRAR